MVDLFRYRHWDLVSKRGLYYVISGLMLFVGIVFWFYNINTTGRPLNEGIDFRGGGLISYRIDGTLPTSEHPAIIGAVREALKGKDVESEVQISPGENAAKGDVILVRTLLPTDTKDQAKVLSDQIEQTITPSVTKVLGEHDAKLAAGQQPEASEVVTGTVSDELKSKAFLAVFFGSALILLWIWVRYNIGGLGARYALAGILALLHDLGTLVGMFAIFHNFLQVNSPFIAALLTVLGFSIHDTIVIFDRIRENMRLRKGRTFAETVNISLLETLARSVNTVLTVLFTLLALFFFGGPTLRDFVAAMLIGVIVGAYSSIFVASQLVVSWSKPEQKLMPTSWDAPVPAMAGGPAPTASAAPTAPSAAPIAAPTTADADAVKRARQAGKTSKRRR